MAGVSSFRVEPRELEAAAAILRSTDRELEELSRGGLLNQTHADFGSPQVQAALAEFARRASAVADALLTAVDHVSSNLGSASRTYVETDMKAMPDVLPS